MRGAIAALVVSGLWAAPVAAQGPLAPSKVAKSEAADAIEALSALAERIAAGNTRGAEDELVAALHAPLKALGLQRFPVESRPAVKAALLDAERAVHRALRDRPGGSVGDVLARAMVETAFQEYLSALERHLRPRP